MDHSKEDVNGSMLSDAAKTQRIAALALCLKLHSALDDERRSEKGEMIASAIKLFEDLGVHSDNINIKREAFLCITCSGLLLLCVDIALKAIEEWCNFSSARIVKSAGCLLTLNFLQGAEGVTPDNWKRCLHFVQREMPDFCLPVELEEESSKVFPRWTWYIESNNNTNLYFERYVFESIKNDAITKITEVYEHSHPAGRKGVYDRAEVSSSFSLLLTC